MTKYINVGMLFVNNKSVKVTYDAWSVNVKTIKI